MLAVMPFLMYFTAISRGKFEPGSIYILTLRTPQIRVHLLTGFLIQVVDEPQANQFHST